MTSTAFEERTLTELDHARLARLLQRDPRAPLATVSTALQEALTCDHLVPSREVAPDVVTMIREILFQPEASGDYTL